MGPQSDERQTARQIVRTTSNMTIFLNALQTHVLFHPTAPPQDRTVGSRDLCTHGGGEQHTQHTT